MHIGGLPRPKAKKIPVKMQEGRFFRQMNVKIVSYYDTYLQSLLEENLWYTQTFVTLCNSQIREQILVLDLYVLTVELLAYKKD